MKRFNWLMAMLAVVTLAFVACENPSVDEPTEQPGTEDPGTEKPGDTEKGLTFEVTLGEITASSAIYSVTPSDLEAEYLCVIYDKESADEFTKDEYLIATLYQELETEARTTGKTLAEYMPEIVDKGVITDAKVARLAPESSYYIILFGVDATKNYAATTKAFKTEFTTTEAETLATTFEIDTKVDGNSATFTITPSNDDDIWYFYTLPKGTHDYYTSPDGYQMTPQTFLLYCLEMDIENWRSAGYTDGQIMNSIFHKGTVTLEAKGLNANTEYINMVAGFFVTEDGTVTIATEPFTTTYTTGDAKASELTFDVSVTNIEAMKASIKITPSNNKETFCWMVDVWDGVSTPEQVMEQIIDANRGYLNAGWMLYSGVQDYTGGPGSPYKFSLPTPDTDYYAIAFGYSGGPTTEPKMVTFHSLEAPDPATTEFNMTAENVSPYSCDIAVTASHNTTYYVVDVINPSEWNEEEMVNIFNSYIDEYYEMYLQYDPNTTISDILGMYYKGNLNITANGLTPNSTLMGYIMALSYETGHVVKTHVFENLVTTKPVGDITPSVEIVGHYSGDEENGSVFGQPDATKGKAISVVKYGNLDGARSLFSTMLGDDITNLNEYPDSQVWNYAYAYWSDTTIAQPYSFYIADWDYPQTALAYAVDQNGNPGGIGRAYSCATAENKGSIADLKALVDELNAEAGKTSKSFSMPVSVVVGQNTGIQKTFKSANVEMPTIETKAEMKAEAKTFAPSYNTTYVRPFYM